MSMAIMTLREGKEELIRLEDLAADSFHTSEGAFTRGVRSLWEIRERDLWHFATDEDGVYFRDHEKPEWGKYLNLFIQRRGISRSGIYNFLGIPDIWVNVLHRDLDELESIGIRRAEPIKELVGYDRRTGSVIMPPPEVMAKLPPGEDPIERVNKKIEEVLIEPAVPLTDKDVKRALTIDIDPSKDETAIWEAGDGVIWASVQKGGEIWDGKVFVPTREMPDWVIDHLYRRMGIRAYKGG